MGIESVEIVVDLERAFGVDFPNRIARNEVFGHARTVAELEDVTLRLRAEQLAPEVVAQTSEEAVRGGVRAIVARVLNVPVDRVTPEAELVRDLGVDT